MIDDSTYRNWYNKPHIHEKMVEGFKQRESCVLGSGNYGHIAVRNMNINQKDHLIQNMVRFKLFDDHVNFYHSVAILQNMPVFSFNFDKRREQSAFFDECFHEYMVGYDWVIDFDSKDTDPQTALGDMRTVHTAFVDMRIPHTVNCSGSGFHIRVESNVLWGGRWKFNAETAPDICGALTHDMVERWRLPSVDLTIYDYRRLIKQLFTLDTKSGNACVPLDQWTIDHFTYDLVKPHYVINNRRIFKVQPFMGEHKSLDKWIKTVR